MRLVLVFLLACSSSKPVASDGAAASDAGLGAGATCLPADDHCASGLKCCTGPTQPPHASCVVPTGSGTCPLLP